MRSMVKFVGAVVASALMLGGLGGLSLAPPPANAGGPPSLAPVATKLLDSVVNISTSQVLKGPQGIPLPKVPDGSPFQDFFRDFFDNRGGGDDKRVNSLGSGFIIDASGLVVTNNHVIADADEITLFFSDGTSLKVDKVIGRDAKTDLALLKVTPTKPLTPVKIGNSSAMNVGDWVMAIGNPLGVGVSVTLGIVSAKKRDINAGPYDEFLQTDAAINKGNSGGPLFNMEGELVGINTAIISPTGVSIGLGFAIPSNAAMAIVDQLRKDGEVRRGWIGVNIQPVTEEIAKERNIALGKGAYISQVAPGGPGEKAGVKTGDVIIKFGDEVVAEVRDLPKLVARAAIGGKVPVDVLRDGKTESLTVTVERLIDQTAPTPAVAKDKPADAVPDAAVEAPLTLSGMTLVPLTDAARKERKIADEVDGVLVLKVEAASAAADKGLQNGDVISEIANEKVTSPAQVKARLDAIQAAGRQSALLLVTDPKGEIRFVALPLQ
jgi:serine protease Do